MSPVLFTQTTVLNCFPRVSGDEPLKPICMVSAGLFSPRERG